MSFPIDDVGKIDGLVAAAISQKLSFAVWAMPHQDQTHGIMGLARPYQLDEQLPSGFIFSAFDNADLKKCLYIPSEGYFHLTNCPKIAVKPPLDWKQGLQNICTHTPCIPISKQGFIDNVLLAQKAMQQGVFLKVVLARTQSKPYSENFSLDSFFHRIIQKYPSAFKALIYSPGLGLWACASPELLCGSSGQGRYFHTMALAGTQPVSDPNADIGQIGWRTKEMEEQALVSRYIVDCFKKIRLREFHEAGPKTILAGQLYHIQTNFCVDTHATNRPELAAQMLALLHPTSAVCGMPHGQSLDFIKQAEPHGRGLYGGFLGPCKMPNQPSDSQIFVMLRAAKLEADHINAYAGAGITADSVAQNEWHETELKARTLLSLLD